MAKINQIKLRQDADAAEKAGRFDKAIELLKQIGQENPKKDWNTEHRIGDLYAKLNNLKAANEQYIEVAKYFAGDGFHLKAIAVWKKVLRNDPSMLEANRELGDLYARQGLVAEAKQTLSLVVDEYIKRSKKREAGEVLRRLAEEVDPSDMKVRIRLAEFYARDGNLDKAADQYVAIADELVKKGHLAEALQLIEKALRSGPRSPRLLSAAARVHLVQKDFARAIEHLEEARRTAPPTARCRCGSRRPALGSKRPDDARKVLEALLQRDPSDEDARLQLGQVYLAEGRYDEAFEQVLPAVDKLVERRQIDRGAGILQQIVQRNPSHIRSLGKLVELYRQSRNDSLVAQTYSQMVEAYLAAGSLDHAASILEMLVQLEPHNDQHRSKLRWLREQQGDRPAGGFEVDFEQPPAPSLPVSPEPPRRAGQPVGMELSGPLSADDQEFIDDHLSEGRVFRKYGLGDKAKDQFEAVLARFPDNLEALQELVDHHREKGEHEPAALRLRAMAQVHRLKGDPDKAASLDAEAAALAPSLAPAVPAPAVLPRAPAPAVPLRGRGRGPTDVGVEITIEEPAHQQEEMLEEFEDMEPVALEPEPAFGEDELAPAGDIGGQFIDEEEPEAAAQLFDLEEAPAAAAPTVTTGLVAQPAPAAAPVGGVPPDLRRALDEIESYVSMGFVEDAKGVLDEMGDRFAGHPALVQRLAELGLEVQAPPFPVGDEFVLAEPPAPITAAPAAEEPLQLGSDFLEFTPTASSAPFETPAFEGPLDAAPAGAEIPGGDGFDLASELGDLFGAQPAVAAQDPSAPGTDLGDASLADIFREFQKGVDKQLGKEDYETRYNLGIAYKEMGLVDEAIAEFQLAAKDEARLLECASMLGICFLEKGMPKLAVKWFEKGLSAPGRTDDEYKGISYDLGDALEQSDAFDEGPAFFEEVYGQDASFRDVAERIERLREKIRQGAARR